MVPLFSKFKISSFELLYVTVRPGLCRTWSETLIVGFLMQRIIYNLNLALSLYIVKGSTFEHTLLWFAEHETETFLDSIEIVSSVHYENMSMQLTEISLIYHEELQFSSF